jgi:hypothetical protein
MHFWNLGKHFKCNIAKGRVLRTALELQAPNLIISENKIAILPFVGFRVFYYRLTLLKSGKLKTGFCSSDVTAYSCLVQDECEAERLDRYVESNGNKARVRCAVVTDGKGPYDKAMLEEKEIKPELGQFVSIFTVELMKPSGYFSSFSDNLGMVCSILPKSTVNLVVLVEHLATDDHWFCSLVYLMCSNSRRCDC